MRKIPFLLITISILLASCTPKYIKEYKKDMVKNPETQTEKDRNTILQYLADNKLEYKRTESGIYYTIEEEGEGNHPTKESIVEAHYRGTLLESGKEFDSSYESEEPRTFTLNKVIKGWQESIPLLKTGGKGTFIIPSELAYGERGAGGDIPENAVLVFRVELLDHYTPAEKAERMKAKEQDKIRKYLALQGMDAQRTESGIHYVIEKPGAGKQPNLSDFVKIHYEGKLLDGTVFDSSYERGEPATMPLRNLIKGWQEGIPLLREGGEGTFIIPSHLAYGSRRQGKIPPNSILSFKVELIKVMNAQEMREEQQAKQQKLAKEQDETIQKYVREKLLDAKSTPEGVYYIIEKAGTDPKPNLKSKVTLHYRGTLLENGKEFDSSYRRGEPATFPLNRLIPGWQVGIPKFGKGGKGTLIIPSGMAYGPRGAGQDIPPNAILKFEIEILDVQ